MSRSVTVDYETLRERQNRFSKGGYVPARGEVPRVMVRKRNGHTEYWDDCLLRWVPVLTSAEVRALAAPEQELADDYERNDHQ